MKLADFQSIKARAKINIVLDVVGKRKDGYHDIRTIMQTVDLFDIITVRKQAENKISIVTNSSKIPVGSRNLAYKAAKFLRDNYSINSGIKIKIDKKIPVAAGLAGGSADCAASLLGIIRLFDIDISEMDIASAAASLGADVPFCINGGTYLAEGIGEKLTKISSFPQMFVLIAKPNISVSTAWVYNNFKASSVERFPDIEKTIEHIRQKDINAISNDLCNVLESVTIKKYPVINDIKKAMIRFGALGALMSGSGPSVFGLFQAQDRCLNAMKSIRGLFDDIECFAVSTAANN